jgi:hypothetical protein
MQLPDSVLGLAFPEVVARVLDEEAARKGQARDSTNFIAEVQRSSLASACAAKLRFAIQHFDANLDANHEVGMRLVNFGQAVTFHVDDVRYHNPSLIFFRGTTEEGHRVELIQHVSQISFLLLALPKPDPNKPKRPFGFAPQECSKAVAPDRASPATSPVVPSNDK